jgi:transcriptional regulator with XRE-family HTH domain
MRFGAFIKSRRQADPRELTLRDVARFLGISISYLSDVEQGRRKPFDSARIEKFCIYLGLPDEDRSLMYDLAALETGKVPSDIKDILMYTEIGDLAWHALRLSNAGVITEDDWREFIRSAAPELIVLENGLSFY